MLFKLIKKKECFGHFKLTNLVKTKLYNKNTLRKDERYGSKKRRLILC